MPDRRRAGAIRTIRTTTTGTDRAAARRARAWLILTAVLAVHVVDEAITDFLSVYNPFVLGLRARIPWLPLPTFTFGAWIAGLTALVAALACLTPAVRRGARGTRIASWAFSAIMFFNGLGHLGVSMYTGEWISGASTAPLLLAASVWLARAAAVRGSGPGAG